MFARPAWVTHVRSHALAHPGCLTEAGYALALGAHAGAGMDPVFFVKTGWPSPNAPVPPGSLVPYYGGYTDQCVQPEGLPWRLWKGEGCVTVCMF